MYKADVEIYADSSNYAVMRHPGRNFPGALIQGDSLSILCRSADSVRRELENGEIEEAQEELDYLREMLWGLLLHYEQILKEHKLPLPYTESHPQPPFVLSDEED